MNEPPFKVVPLSPLRQVIAARMSEAKRTVPHFRVGVDIEIDALLGMRAELNASSLETRISINDCIVKACASALLGHPNINIQLVEGTIHQYRSVHISVVMAVPGGLSTPIVFGAEAKSVWDIAREVQALTARAAKNMLKMREILGGSFSISNLGMYGADRFDAIVNPPQCAILAIGRAVPRVVVNHDRSTRVASVLQATLSVDHRAIDGAIAAAFLSTLRERLEQPKLLRDILFAGVGSGVHPTVGSDPK